MKNLSVSDERFDNEVEAYIQQSHVRISRESHLLAISLSETVVSKEEFEHYCASIRAQYDEVWHHIKKWFKGDMHRATGSLERKIAETEIGINQTHVQGLKEKARIAKLDRDRVELNYHWKYFWIIYLVEGLIFLGEFVFNILPFTIAGDMVIIAIPIALFFSIGLCIAAIKIPVVLKKISNAQRRTQTAVLIAIGMLTLFIMVSLLRSVMAVGGGTLASLSTHTVIIGAVIFTVIQFAMFVFAALFAWFLPTEKDHKDKDKYDGHNKEYNVLVREIEVLEGRNRSIPVETMRSLRDKFEIIHEENHHKEHIQTLSENTVKAFQSEYTLRKGGGHHLLS